MAEQLAHSKLGVVDGDYSESDSSEESEVIDDGPDIFADDMELGEEASTLEDNRSKHENKNSIQFSEILEAKGSTKTLQGRKK